MEEAEGRIGCGSGSGKTNDIEASVVGSRDSRALLSGLAVPRCYKLALHNTSRLLTTIFFHGSLFFFGTQSIGAFLPSVFTTPNTPQVYSEYTRS